jgi:hypothetical protein
MSAKRVCGQYDFNVTSSAKTSGAAANEATRLARLRADGRRSPSVNLAEGIALSHKLMQFAGAAHKSS